MGRDSVHIKQGGKQAQVGLSNNIRAEVLPAPHAGFGVRSVTDIRPDTKPRLDILHRETGRPSVGLEGPPPGRDRTTICDFTFVINRVTFLEPGRYYIRLMGNNHIRLQQPFEVSRTEG